MFLGGVEKGCVKFAPLTRSGWGVQADGIGWGSLRHLHCSTLSIIYYRFSYNLL